MVQTSERLSQAPAVAGGEKMVDQRGFAGTEKSAEKRDRYALVLFP